MIEQFDEWNPQPATLGVIHAAEVVIQDMAGYEPTLRSVYYQLVANKVIENKQSEYNRHDPSGIDMTRDNGDRLSKYGWLSDVSVERIALNMAQVEEYGLPPDPAKLTDSRAESYIMQYGNESWELDALKPQILEPLIEGAIKKHIDAAAWNEVGREEQRVTGALEWISQNSDEVLEFAQSRLDEESEL